jgi:DNA topoisomerase-1
MKEGYLQVYSPEIKADPASLRNWELALKRGEVLLEKHQFHMKSDVTRPQPYYNEATFVKVMESEGIGRPSTYASVIDKLFDKGYITKGVKKDKQEINVTHYKSSNFTALGGRITSENGIISVGNEDKSSMITTDIGKHVVTYVGTVTPYLIDPTFTKLMESDLDKITKRETTKKKILDDFYSTFGSSVNVANNTMVKVQGAKDTTKPDKTIKEFPELGSCIMNTKYGPALYTKSTKKFNSITPFLEWRQKTPQDFNERDAR